MQRKKGRGAARVQRVQKVQRVQRVAVAADAADYKKRGRGWRRGLCKRVVSPQGKRLTTFCASLRSFKMCSLCIADAQGATAPAALKVADCRSAAMLIKSALRVWPFCVIEAAVSGWRIADSRLKSDRLTSMTPFRPRGGCGCRRGLCRRVVFAGAQGATAAPPLRVVDCPYGQCL